MATEGVDYSFSRPSPSGLAAAGKKFAVRYGGPGSSGKWLTASELAALTAAGIDVVANAEGSASGYRGEAAGRSWASSAVQYFRKLGMPADRPIYFSVDWDADSSDWADIDAALRGSASVIGRDLVGVYGSYDTIAHCKSAGTAAWLWQTYAWSSGRLHPAAHLYQYHNGVTIGGGDCDLTRALVTDYGQWGFEGEAMAFIDDQKAFTAAVLSAFKDGDVRKAMVAGVLNTDGVLPAPPGSVNADGSPNAEFTAHTFLYQTLVNSRAAGATQATFDAKVSALLQTLLTYAAAEATEIPPTAQQNADAVVAALGADGPQEAAQALAAVLGLDKAVPVAEAILALARPGA